jgi:predicted membrane protein
MKNITNSQDPQKPSISKKSLMFGVLIILFGIALLLRNFGLLTEEQKTIIFSWKTILIAIGVMNLIGKEFFSGIMLISIGMFFHLTHYYELPLSIKNLFWPAVIIAAGIVILTKHFRISHHCRFKTADEVAEYFEDTSIFGGNNKFIKNNNFRGAKVTAIFGGSKINMQQVLLSPEGATIDMTLIFGGCELIVPPDWNIHVTPQNIFGGTNDKRILSDIDLSKNLYIKGTCVFGGCEIKSF